MLSRAPRPGLDPRARLRVGLAALPLLCLAAACGESPSDPTQDDPCAPVGEVSVSQTHSGQLSTDDCQLGSGGFSDRWTLRVTAATTVRIDLRSGAFDALLELHSSSGAMIASNDDAIGLDSRITHTLAPGSYVLLVRSFHPGATGSYSLSVAQAPDCTAIGTVTVDGPIVTGTLAATDCASDWNAPMDNWTLQLTASARLRIDLESAQLDEVVLVRNQQSILHGADWTHPSGHARLDVELPAGTWTISATAPHESARGDYQLRVGTQPPCTPGTELTVGASVSGSLSADDCIVSGWMPADSFAVVIDEDASIHVTLKSDDFTPLAVLRDQSGVDVSVAQDVTQSGIAEMRVALTEGRYVLLAMGYPPEGAYSLTVDEVVCPAPQTIAFGATVSGSLDPSDCTRPGGAFRDPWELTLTDTATVRIDLASTAFDPYLVVRDGSGVVVATDDDSGPGLNARIDVLLSAGTYEVLATSYLSGVTGAYSLTAGPRPASVSGAAAPTDEREVKPEPMSGSVRATDLLEGYARQPGSRGATPWLPGSLLKR